MYKSVHSNIFFKITVILLLYLKIAITVGLAILKKEQLLAAKGKKLFF